HLAELQTRHVERLPESLQLDGHDDRTELLDDARGADTAGRAGPRRALRERQNPAAAQSLVNVLDVLGIDLALDGLIAIAPRALDADRAVVRHHSPQEAVLLHRLERRDDV